MFISLAAANSRRRLHGLQLSVESEKLGPVLARAVNKKQHLILQEVLKNRGETATAMLSRLSKESLMPLSTLKLNLKLLKELDLVFKENSKPVKLTVTGVLVLKIFDKHADKTQSSLIGKAVVCKTTNPGSSPGSETNSKEH